MYGVVDITVVSQINACVRVVDKREPTFAVCITKVTLKHNHSLDKRIYQQYASNRMMIDDDTLAKVEILRKAGANKKNIYRFIVENTDSSPTGRDVHNLIRKLKAREVNSTTTASRLKKWMEGFCEEPGNVGRIFIDRIDGKVRTSSPALFLIGTVVF